MLRLRFNQLHAANQIKGRFLHGTFPAQQRAAPLGLGDRVHDILPRPVDAIGVARHQVGAGDLEVDGRLPERLVFGMANPARGFRIPRFQAVLFLQQPVFQKEDPAVPSKHQIPFFHLESLPLVEDTERGINRVSGYWASARTVRPESEPPVNLLEILLEVASVSFASS